MNLIEISTNPPQYISGKHLKGILLSEVIESNPLLPNYTLLLKVRKSGDDLIISSAKYTRRDDGRASIETKEIFPPMFAEPTERNTFIDFEKKQTFRSLRKVFAKLSPKGKERFQMLLKFAMAEMQIELIRSGQKRRVIRG